ncbi:MAG TPA: cadherin-like domain-containing protein, partial [Blastocatellia bacterium]|nr:cadherin-like domain-containing protein [Blastocatellia bacterium]
MRNRSNLVVNVIRLFMISIGLMFCSVAESDLSNSHAGRVSPGSGTELAIPSMPTVGETSTSISQPTIFTGTATPLAPTVTATKSHTPTGNRSPGDTLTYTVVISVSGMDATGVNFTDTIDPNTTLVANSLVVSPIAVNNTYNTIGNVNISVPVAQGVVANDLNPGGMGTLTVTQVNGTAVPGTAATTHGSVTMAADGSFTYNPTAGFGGPSDSFTYTLGNGTGKTDTATVTINISGRIWFVNSAAGSNGDGRLSSPFNILTGAGSADSVDAANDVIFLYSSATNYTGGMTLNSGEIIIGQGASQSILSITGFPAPSGTNLLPATGGTNPTITAATANEITLGSNNQIWGTTFGNTTGSSVTGSGYGTLKVRDTTINNGSGQALNLSTGTMDVILQSLTSTGSVGTGMTLNASAGSFSVTGTTSITNSGGTGVSLTTNTGTITFAALSVTNTTSNKSGLVATDNSNTITITSGAINSGATGPAVQITRSSGTTPLVVSLTSVSANGGANGIVLSNTSGSFTITGDGSHANNGSGGTIQNSTSHGMALTNTQNLSFESMSIHDTSGSGVKGVNGAGGAQVNNFSFTHGTINNSGTGGGVDESNIAFNNVTNANETNLTGTVTITNNTLTNSRYHGVDIQQFGGTITTLTISN